MKLLYRLKNLANRQNQDLLDTSNLVIPNSYMRIINKNNLRLELQSLSSFFEHLSLDERDYAENRTGSFLRYKRYVNDRGDWLCMGQENTNLIYDRTNVEGENIFFNFFCPADKYYPYESETKLSTDFSRRPLWSVVRNINGDRKGIYFSHLIDPHNPSISRRHESIFMLQRP